MMSNTLLEFTYVFKNGEEEYTLKTENKQYVFYGSHIIMDENERILCCTEDRLRSESSGRVYTARINLKRHIFEIKEKLLFLNFEVKRINHEDVVVYFENHWKIIFYADTFTAKNTVTDLPYVSFLPCTNELSVIKNKTIENIYMSPHLKYANVIFVFDDCKLCIFCLLKHVYKYQTSFISYTLRARKKRPALHLEELVSKKVIDVVLVSETLYKIILEGNHSLFMYVDNRYDCFVEYELLTLSSIRRFYSSQGKLKAKTARNARGSRMGLL